MTKYTVEFEKDAQNVIKKMDRYEANFIMSWIAKNLNGTDNPRIHGKALVANHKGKWRYRVGNYRLIAEIDDEKVTILMLNIGHRRDIYS